MDVIAQNIYDIKTELTFDDVNDREKWRGFVMAEMVFNGIHWRRNIITKKKTFIVE